MKNPSVIRTIKLLFPVLLWSFVIYNLSPFGYFEVYEVKERLAPRPYVERISYYFGVKIKNPEKVIEVLKEREVGKVFGFSTIQYNDKIFPIAEIPKCDLIMLNDISFFQKLFNFFLEFFPYQVISDFNVNYAYHINPLPSFCKIFFTYTLYEEYPKFLRDFLLDYSRNVVYKRVHGRFVMERNIIVNGKEKVEIYGYSTRSFYYPGESTIYPFRLFVNTNRENTLIMLYRNGRLFRVYDTDRVAIKIEEEGEYVVKVYKYRFKYLNYYFGLRFVAYSSPIGLTY